MFVCTHERRGFGRVNEYVRIFKETRVRYNTEYQSRYENLRVTVTSGVGDQHISYKLGSLFSPRTSFTLSILSFGTILTSPVRFL
jgi:hypothetical protein